MPKFRKPFDNVEVVPAPAGTTVYEYEILVDGKLVTEEWQVQKDIQSYADDCNVKALLDSYARTGDENVLKQKKGVYADVTDLPKDLHELKSSLDLIDKIDKLPKKEEPTPESTPEPKKEDND